MTPREVVSLKEYFEVLLRERDQALRLQAAEYERRLQALNHEHARIQSIIATYVTQERYNIDMEHLKEFQEIVEKEMSHKLGQKHSFGMFAAIIYAVVIATISAAGVLVNALRIS